MASQAQPTTSSVSNLTEYSVRLPRNLQQKNLSVMKFNVSNNVDLTTCGGARIERENNLREFKSANDLDLQPRSGAGSEFGREQREEARRKKYGIMARKYITDDQPWLLRLGSGKQIRRFKGTKEGGVCENASYFIFTQCADGAFEVYPVEEWYNFAPQVKYKYLNADEAEEEFTRRDKTLNFFNIMLKKRLRNEEDGVLDGDDGEVGKKKAGKKVKKDKSLMLTDLDEWADMSDDVDDGDSDDGLGDDADKAKSKSKKQTEQKKPKKNKKKANSDDEAFEESDSMDEGQEVDYMSDDESSDDEDMYDTKGRGESEKYEEKGVAEEEGLRRLVDSGDEADSDEEEKKEEQNEEEEDTKNKEEKNKDSDSGTSSESDSDSDPEKDSNFASPLFMQQERRSSSRVDVTKSDDAAGPSGSQSTSSVTDTDGKASKRRTETPSPQPNKKIKTEANTVTPASTGGSGSVSDSLTEDVRRYLMRKPMTTTEILQKCKSKNTGLSKDQLVNTVAQILKRLNPEKTKTKDKLYLFIKKPA